MPDAPEDDTKRRFREALERKKAQANAGAAHKDGGAKVGKVTSAIYSPRLKKNIGYCWLPVDMAKDGTRVRVESEWGTRNATVVPMPFVDPDKRIPVS